MREVQLTDLLGDLPALMAAVERGDTLVIKRGSRVLARMTPEAPPVQSNVLNWYKRPVLVATGPILVDGEDHSTVGNGRCSCSLCFAGAAAD